MHPHRSSRLPRSQLRAGSLTFKRLLLSGLLVLVSVVFSRPVLAGGSPVKELGPGITVIYAMVVHPTDPDILYAATGAGVYKSLDTGASWSDSSRGLLERTVYSLAIDPTNPNILYAVTDQVYKSSDGGASWTPTGSGTIRGAASIVVDPSDPDTLYAGTQVGTLCCGWFGNGIYKSSDGGETWAKAGDLFAIGALTLDPTQPETVYASSCWGRPSTYLGECTLQKSLDGGSSWITSTVGLPNSMVMDLVVDPIQPQTLYAALGGNQRIYKSVDGGANWYPSSVGITASIYSLALDPLAPGRLYAGTDGGIYRTIDAGDTWDLSAAGIPSLPVTALALHPDNPTRLSAGTGSSGSSYSSEEDSFGGGIYTSANAGQDWAPASTGLPGDWSHVSGLSFDSNQPPTLYANTYQGPFKADDDGELWQPAFPGLPNARQATALAVDPGDPLNIYVGIPGEGIYKSSDGGATWNPVNTGLGNTDVGALVIDPQQPATLYAGANNLVYKTTDGGEHWELIYTYPDAVFFNEVITLDPVAPSTLYVGAKQAVAKSTDAGEHWTELPLPIPPETGAVIQALAIDPDDPATLYAATGIRWSNGEEPGGVYKSLDGGSHWVPFSTGLPAGAIWSLAIDPSNPRIVYTGAGSGVYKTMTGGTVWYRVPRFPEQIRVNDLHFHPNDPTRLYIGSERGVFVVENFSQTGFLPFLRR